MRILPAVLPLAIACSAAAQCLVPTGGTPVTLTPTTGFAAANDEGLSAPIVMGINFPMAGAASPTYSHAVIDSNGGIYLTNGGPAIGTLLFGPQNGVDDLRGNPGDSPRVFPLWSDYEGIAPTWAITVDSSVPGEFRVTWRDVELAGSAGQTFSLRATLFASGAVELLFGDLANDAYGSAGISIGNGVGTGLESPSPLVAGADSGSLGLLFGEYGGFLGLDIDRKSVLITPNGNGGYTSTRSCTPAEHVPYGEGCYTYQEANEAVYQLFPTVAASFAAIQPGRSIQFTIIGSNSYLVSEGGGSYVPPSPTATVLALTDDSQANVAPSLPFPHANGSIYPILSVCSNGFVNMAPAGVNPNGTGGSGSRLVEAPAPSFRSQRDYNPAPAASGKVKWEEVVIGSDLVLVVTWDNVFIFSTTISERFQIQLNLVTGQVTMVWDNMAPSTTSSRPLLIGCAPGSSFNPGSINFATALPVVTFPDVEIRPLTLSASPGAALNPSTLVTFTIENAPELTPGSGIYAAGLFLAFAPAPAFDLGFIGAPGCNGLLPSADLSLGAVTSTTPTLNFPLLFSSNVVPLGTVVYTQAASIFDANFPLPNGANPAGIVTSNGLITNAAAF